MSIKLSKEQQEVLNSLTVSNSNSKIFEYKYTLKMSDADKRKVRKEFQKDIKKLMKPFIKNDKIKTTDLYLCFLKKEKLFKNFDAETFKDLKDFKEEVINVGVIRNYIKNGLIIS